MAHGARWLRSATTRVHLLGCCGRTHKVGGSSARDASNIRGCHRCVPMPLCNVWHSPKGRLRQQAAFPSFRLSAFISTEIKQFYTANGIQAITSPACHTATNGQAERYVAELKRALLRDTDKFIQCRLARFLYRQHNYTHCHRDDTCESHVRARTSMPSWSAQAGDRDTNP